MKRFLIIYCEAADEDVIAALREAGLRGYTKMVEARGEGTDTEPKLGTHYCLCFLLRKFLNERFRYELIVLSFCPA